MILKNGWRSAYLGSFYSTAVTFGSHTAMASLLGDKKGREMSMFVDIKIHIIGIFIHLVAHLATKTQSYTDNCEK